MPLVHMIVPASRTSSNNSAPPQDPQQLASSSTTSLSSSRRKSVFSALFGSRLQSEQRTENPEEIDSAGPESSTAGGMQHDLGATSNAFLANSQTMANLNGELADDAEVATSTGTSSFMDVDQDFSIRLTPFIDHSSSAPFLYFGPMIRKIKPGTSIPIGRYTDKLKHNSASPIESIVFKSKVVSRSHAELFVNEKGEWFIKDIKSSSGTFLNRLRLSPAGVESTNHVLQDGDILQLGMDFRGGTEEIFRCVKMKVELNDSWLRRTQKFNKEAHEKLKLLTLSLDKEKLDSCAICLNDIKPCQAVFVSSCSHSWHYKCIRPIVVKSYPQFLCPNCKAVCDLESELEEDED